MAIQKNESLQAMMDRLVPQGGAKVGGSSLSLAGAKPTTASVGSSPGKLQTSTAGNVPDWVYFDATMKMATKQQGYKQEQDRLNRSSDAIDAFSRRQTAASDSAWNRKTQADEFAMREKQLREDNNNRTRENARAYALAQSQMNLNWDAERNKKNLANQSNKLEKERIRTQSVIGKAQVGAERQGNELQFEAAKLTDTTNKEKIGADERVAKEQNQFGLFSNLMNSYASTKQRDPFGYLNI